MNYINIPSIFRNSFNNKLSRIEILLIYSVSFVAFIFFFITYRNLLLSEVHWDVGWIRNVTWRNPSQVMPIECCSLDGENSKYISWTWHFVPLFSLVSLISYLWPLGQESWIVSFFAIQPTIVITCTLILTFKKFSNYLGRTFILIFSLILSLSYGTLRAAKFPHFELFYLGFILLFLVFASSKHQKLSIGALLLLLITKEDFAIYLLILLWFTSYKILPFRQLISYSANLILLPVIYLSTLQLIHFSDTPNMAFPNQTNLESQYLGKPWFRHLTAAFIRERIHDNFISNGFLFLTIAFLLGAFLLTNQRISLRFILSTLPHFLIALVAFATPKGIMDFYVLIPLWTSILLSLLFIKIEDFEPQKLRLFVLTICLFLSPGILNSDLASIIHDFKIKIPRSYSLKIAESQVRKIITDGIYIDGRKVDYLFDTNFFAVSPNSISANSWVRDLNSIKNIKSCVVSLSHSSTIKNWEKINSSGKLSREPILGTNYILVCN